MEKKQRPEKRQDEPIRLNKFIANSGVCSRRNADTLIQEGKIKVNGEVVTELGFKVSKNDQIELEGKQLAGKRFTYVLLNKPKGFITTTNDPLDRKIVMELVKNATSERIYPVGRLDRDTTGLLLFTNDGDLANALTHPSSNIGKIYKVTLNKTFSPNDLQKIMNGIELEDGVVHVDDVAIDQEDKTVVGIEIHSGKNRIVRRIFEHLNYEVKKLDRVVFADLTKKDLPRGKWRYLSEKEVRNLKKLK